MRPYEEVIGPRRMNDDPGLAAFVEVAEAHFEVAYRAAGGFVTDDVIQLELRLLDPMVRADSELVRELLRPDFVEHGVWGRVWRRERMISALAEDPFVSGDVEGMQATVLSEGVVLVTYRIIGYNSSLRSSVWVRTDGRWQLRFHQGTPIR